jgi:hypothetical protein
MLKFVKWSTVLLLGVMMSLFLIEGDASAQKAQLNSAALAAKSAVTAGAMQGAKQTLNKGNCVGGGFGVGGNFGNCGCGAGVGNCGGPITTRQCSSKRICHEQKVCNWSFGRKICSTRKWCESVRVCNSGGFGGWNSWDNGWVRP